MVNCSVCGKEIKSEKKCIICEKKVCATHYRSMMGVCMDCAPKEEKNV